MSRGRSPRRGCKGFMLAGMQLSGGLLLAPVGGCLADCQTLAGKATFAYCSELTDEKASWSPGHRPDWLLARSPASDLNVPSQVCTSGTSAEPCSSPDTIAQDHTYILLETLTCRPGSKESSNAPASWRIAASAELVAAEAGVVQSPFSVQTQQLGISAAGSSGSALKRTR